MGKLHKAKPPEKGRHEAESEMAIRRSAMQLFADKGYEATSVREIVEMAGVTKPTLYYYFENKEMLYRSLIIETLEAFKTDMLHAIDAANGFRNELMALARSHFWWLRREPLMTAALFREVFGAAPERRRVDVMKQADFEESLILDIFSRAATRGEISPAFVNYDTVRLYFASIHLYIMRQALGFKDDLNEALAEEIVDFFLGGLLQKQKNMGVPEEGEAL